jgi:uncharacterized protein
MGIFGRKRAFWGLGLATAFSVLLLLLQPQVRFDYDFESFFPQDDPEMDFFSTFRTKFGNDNDYLLLALGAEEDAFERSFLYKADQLRQQLIDLNGVEGVYSLLDYREPVINPFGIRYIQPLDLVSPENSREMILQDPQMRHLVSADGKYLLLVIQHTQRIEKEDGDKLYNQIHQAIEQSEIKDYVVAGKIKAQGAFVQLMQEEFAFFLLISLILVVLILLLIFQSWWGIVLPLLVLAVGIAWTIAIMLLSGKALDVMSVMQPTILAVVGLAALVHYLNHYLHLLRAGFSKETAIFRAFSDLFPAVSLTCLTTAMGFLSLYFTSVPSLKLFGLYTGIGVLLMFLAVNLIAPALLYLFPPVKAAQKDLQAKRWSMGLRATLLLTFRYRKYVLFGFALATAFSVYALFKLKVDGYILDNLPESHELVQDFVFFDENFGGSKPLEIYLQAGKDVPNLLQLEALQEIEKLEVFVQRTFQSSVVLSPLTLVKAINKAQNGGNSNAFILPSKGQLSRAINLMPRVSEQSTYTMLVNENREGRMAARTADMGSFEGNRLKVELNNFIADSLNKDILQVRLTGTSHLIDRSHETVTFQLAKGLGIAFLLVAIIAGMLFRSFRIAFTVLLPNVIPLLWMCGVMWVLDIDMKLTTAIIFTVAFGVAVDDSIHFMAKLKAELSRGKNLLYATKRTYMEAGKAILLTSIILVSGFSILIFSQFGVTFYAGLLISLALIFALMADLVLLPILLLPMQKVWKYKKGL